MNLQTTGLAFDLIGVILLGVDLLRIQIGLRKAAEVRIERLEQLAEEYGGVDDWSAEIAKSANWAQYADMGERIYEPISGSFDAAAAKESFGEAMQAVGYTARRTNEMADIVMASYEADRNSAGSSLVFTYIGLTLIIVGFCLQIISAI